MQNKKPSNCTNVLKDVCLWANVLKDVCSIQKTLFFLRKIKHFPSRNNVGDFEGGVFLTSAKTADVIFHTSVPSKMQKPLFFLRKNTFLLKTRPSKLRSIYDAILVPTWLHFGSQNRLKSDQISIRRGIQKQIDFQIGFLIMLAPFGTPRPANLAVTSANFGPKTRQLGRQEASKS